jgi:hypothetical protein
LCWENKFIESAQDTPRLLKPGEEWAVAEHKKGVFCAGKGEWAYYAV